MSSCPIPPHRRHIEVSVELCRADIISIICHVRNFYYYYYHYYYYYPSFLSSCGVIRTFGSYLRFLTAMLPCLFPLCMSHLHVQYDTTFNTR